ncbi:MAG: PDZ domain-containing protein [Planctomycetota bacterium]
MTYLIDREGKVFLAWYGYDEGYRLAMAALVTKGGAMEEAIGREQLMIHDPKLLELLELVKLAGIVPDLSEVGMGQPPKVDVLPGSLAEKAGIRSGDRITALNGQAIERIEDVPAVCGRLSLDVGFRVSVMRDGEQVEVSLLAELLKGFMGASRQDTPRR